MALGMQVDLGSGDFEFDGDPATSSKKGTPTPPNFWPMSIVATRPSQLLLSSCYRLTLGLSRGSMLK